MRISDVREADRLILDTHIWVWVNGDAAGKRRLDPGVIPIIEAAARNRRLFVSAASVWELAIKEWTGETLIAGDLMEWVHAQTSFPGVRVLPINARVSVESIRLPEWIRGDGRLHRDPNDRFIVTTAILKNAVLITCDREILAYSAAGHLRACDARR